MKIAVTSDLHGVLPDIEPCEVLLICGDISPLNIQQDYYRMEFWMRSTFAQWVNNLPCDHVIITPGNHDFYLKSIQDDEINKYESIYRPTKGKLEVLYNTECVINSKDNISYKIWGTPYCTEYGPFPFMESSDTLKKLYSEMPYNCDIVISHMPPKIGKYGKILEINNKECGSAELAKVLKDRLPRYCFFGHIHSGDHTLGEHKGYGKTKFANVSYLNEQYLHNYRILYLDI